MVSTDQLHTHNGVDERRRDRRYPIALDLRWRLIHRRKVQGEGVGRTIDLSSSGVLFDARRRLPQGMRVEISVSWPVLLRDQAALQLVVSGLIVRSNGSQVAIRGTKHEFRTVGSIRLTSAS
jgi:hypothetical protein